MALVVLIERPGFRLAADTVVVKRDEVTLVQQTMSALEAARLEAERTNASARLAAEQAGYMEGYRAGRQAAATSLAVSALGRRSAVEQLEALLTQIVVESVSAVLLRIGRERVLFESLSAVREVIRRSHWAVLRVPPSAVEQAQQALAQLQRELGGVPAVQLLPDPQLTDDSCVLETDCGVVDAGLDTLLQSVRNAVTNALQESIALAPAEPAAEEPAP